MYHILPSLMICISAALQSICSGLDYVLMYAHMPYVRSTLEDQVGQPKIILFSTRISVIVR